MKKLFIFLASILLIVVIVLATAYLFRAPLMQSAGPLIADQLGVEIAELDIETISLRQIVIPKFRAKYFAPGQIMDVVVDQLAVQIDPWAGTYDAIKKISAKNIELVINTSDDNAVETEPSARAIDLIRGLPPAVITVERLALTYQYAPENVVLYQGSIWRDQNLLTSNGALLAPGYLHSNVSLKTNLSSSFDLNVRSLKPDKNQLDVTGEFTLDDHWIYLSGNGVANFSEVESYLDSVDLALPLNIKTLASKFNFKVEADLGLPVDQVAQSTAVELDVEAETLLSMPGL